MGCGNFTIITPSPSMAVHCYLRCPSHRTLFADTFFAAFPSYALSADTLRESKLLPPFTRVQPSAGGRPRYQRRAIGDTYSVPSRLGPSVDGRRRMSGSPVKKENQKNKFLGLTVDGRVRIRMFTLFRPTKAKMHGVWKFNNITPSHPSHAVDIFCGRPSMAVGWCLHRRLRRKTKKQNSSDSPSMAVCLCVCLRSLARRRQKCMGCGNLTI